MGMVLHRCGLMHFRVDTDGSGLSADRVAQLSNWQHGQSSVRLKASNYVEEGLMG